MDMLWELGTVDDRLLQTSSVWHYIMSLSENSRTHVLNNLLLVLMTLDREATEKAIAYVIGRGFKRADMVYFVRWEQLRLRTMRIIRQAMHDQRKPYWVNQTLSMLRQTLRYASRLELISQEDCELACIVESVSVPSTKPQRVVRGDELQQVLSACGDDAYGKRDRALISMMYYTGTRCRETLAVNLRDYDPVSGEIRIMGKGGRPRITYANASARAPLDAWIAERGDEDGPLFTSPRSDRFGERYSYFGVWGMLRRRCADAGIPCFGAHALRRICLKKGFHLNRWPS